VLPTDPKNTEAAYKKDALSQTYMLNTEGKAVKDLNREMQQDAIALREAEIPWNVLVNYPPDWQEMTVRRKGTGAGESNETEEDRAVKQKLKTKIPDLTFDNQPFEKSSNFSEMSPATISHVNWTALAVGSIDKTTPINLRLTDVTVEKALQTGAD